MTECGKCGNCCENIITSWDLSTLEQNWNGWVVGPDPTVDLVAFDAWVRENGLELEDALSRRKSCYENYAFVKAHWTRQEERPPDGSFVWDCAKFDSVTRECTAHESRPPICSGYPWYGKPPYRESNLSPQCTFNADIRTMLKIVEVRNGNTNNR